MNHTDFIANLQVGQIIEARFQRIGGYRATPYHSMPARIVSIKDETVKVERYGEIHLSCERGKRFNIVKVDHDEHGIFPLEERTRLMCDRYEA